MAGKTCVFTSRRLYFALDTLSKNALIDLVVDRVRAELGESTSDEVIAEHIQDWLGPVIRERGDKPVSLAGRMAYLDKSDEDYRNKTGKFTQVGG